MAVSSCSVSDKPAGALNGGRPLSIALSQDHLLCPMIQIPHTAAHQPSDMLLHPSRLCTTGSTTLFVPHRCLSQVVLLYMVDTMRLPSYPACHY